jgi:hypothetical protein
MWIRSQEKTDLVNCNCVGIDNCLGKTTIVEHCYNKMYILGFYSTKEKAIKVLDLLQDFMYQESDSTVVFEMPADDAVVTVKKRVDYAEFRELEEKSKMMR